MKAKKFTPQQMVERAPRNLNAFAALILDGRDSVESAALADCDRPAVELLSHARFPDAMLAAMSSKLTGDMLPKALATLLELLKCPDPRIRLGAANSVVRMVIPQQGLAVSKTAGSTGTIESMSAGELAELIDKLEQAKAEKATPVGVMPHNPTDEQPNPLFMFG